MLKVMCSLVLGLAVAQAQAASTEVFLLDAEGSLTVGADGSVIDVKLDNQAALGPDAAKGYEQHIRGWRFEPVIEDGKPVNAMARMKLSLVAIRKSGAREATFGIRRVWFTDPPTVAASNPAGRPKMDRPRYPAGPVREGVGAKLELLVRLDGEGRVSEVATERLVLLGRDPGTHKGKFSANFRKAAEKVAREWIIPGYGEGALVIVPVSFWPTPTTDAWQQVHAGVVELPAWAAAARSEKAAVDLVASGERTSSRLRLLTPLTDGSEGG